AHLLFRFSLFLLPAPVPTALHPLSLHDALPISGRLASRLLSEQPLNLSGHASRRRRRRLTTKDRAVRVLHRARTREPGLRDRGRSEEHTSELQSRENLVCRLLLEKKKHKTRTNT